MPSGDHQILHDPHSVIFDGRRSRGYYNVVPIDTAPRRQSPCHNGTLAGLALKVERTAMERDQGLRQRQTEPYTLMPPAQRTVDLLETGQRLGDIFHGDPNTGIYNLQH